MQVSSEHASNQHISSLGKSKTACVEFCLLWHHKNSIKELYCLGVFPISLKTKHGVYTVIKLNSYFLRATSFHCLPTAMSSVLLCYVQQHFLKQVTTCHTIVTIALQCIFCLILKVQHPEEKGSWRLVTVIVLWSADQKYKVKTTKFKTGYYSGTCKKLKVIF